MNATYPQTNPTVSITPTSSKKVWTGRVLSTLAILFLLFDAGVKLSQNHFAVEATVRIGYPPGILVGLGIVQLICTVLYAVPRTSMLGAILLTGYLGGATATHVRIGDPFLFPVIFGVIVWAALYLREERLHSLVPLRQG
jgi:hypothetical protein